MTNLINFPQELVDAFQIGDSGQSCQQFRKQCRKVGDINIGGRDLWKKVFRKILTL